MRRLGKTNIQVNEIGFGGIPIQRVNQELVNKIVDELLKNNVNLIDTARGYTVSEKFLGKALQGKRDKFILCTKSMSRTYNEMKKDIETSLENLQTNYIDLYQFHNIKNEDEYKTIMSNDGAYLALKEAQALGKIKHIGITSHSLDFLMSIIDNFPFETIQFPYNLIEPSAEELFEKARKNDIGVIVMKSLAGGAIKDTNLAIKFVLNNENVSVVIPGMDSVEQVRANTIYKPTPYTTEELANIETIRKELGDNFCRRCGYCLPCQAGIDIPSCFIIEGYYSRYDLKEWANTRYLSLAHHASECVECHDCESRCPYNLEIVEKLKMVKQIFNK